MNLASSFAAAVFMILGPSIGGRAWESGLRQRYDGYGDDWIFMPDGKGKPQVAVLKFAEDEMRGILEGSQVSYILYTRYRISIVLLGKLPAIETLNEPCPKVRSGERDQIVHQRHGRA